MNKDLVRLIIEIEGVGKTQVRIKRNITEKKLKGYLRDFGIIPYQRKSFRETKVFLIDSDGEHKTEICTGRYRTLEELGFKNVNYLYVVPGSND